MSSKDKVTKPEKRKESKSGFHYINLYQCCQRKFYFRYVKGWSPIHTPSPLINGSAFHEAKANWYMGKSEKQCIKVATGIVEEAKKELGNDEAYNEMLFKLPHLIHYWIEQFGNSDRLQYDVVEVESQHEVPIKDTPYVMTIRPDTILKAKGSKMLLVMETKTSGFSHRLTSEAVYYGDQATAYLWGAKKKYPEIYGVIPDIAYWNSRSRGLDNMKFLRTDVVMRDDYALEMFELGMGRTFTEVNQKMEALKQKVDARILFPRNSFYCLSYSKLCEYAHVCQQDCTKMRVPSELKSDRTRKSLGKYVDDSIAIV